MTKTLRIPDEYRFVRAFALAVEPGDTLSLLLEICALGSRDLGIVRRTREALDAVYDRAGDRKDWEQTHIISVLREALAQPDSAAYLAYAAKDTRQAHEYAEALAVVGCAADSLSSHRRAWEIKTNDISLPDWRERVWKLLFGMPGTALPKPAEPHPPTDGPCTCCESDSCKALAGEHAAWCPASEQPQGRS